MADESGEGLHRDTSRDVAAARLGGHAAVQHQRRHDQEPAAGTHDVRSDAEPAPTARVLSVAELEAFERANIARALESASWKVSGVGGAAALSTINVSTLNSRMRALKIRRPRGA